MSPAHRTRRAADYDHKKWLSLIEVSGPFLSVPVLRQTWPALDALDKTSRERLRARHADWRTDPAAGRDTWLAYVLGDLLEWGDALHGEGLDGLAVPVAEHDTMLTAGFALVQPGKEIKSDTVRVIGVIVPTGTRPASRIPGSTWAATPVDRLAQMCRHHGIELGLATDGRFFTLVWAPRSGATTTATFDAVAWPEAAERDVVRAFVSLLRRSRFFAVPDEQRLVPLLRESLDNQEEITEALGVQVRQAVELLVAAFGRIDVNDRRLGGRGLRDVDAHEVYRGAVSVMMRIVFLLFAEERKLLPADNELYATAYSAGRLCSELEARVTEGSEEDLEHSTAAWQRLIALGNAVYAGVDHPRLTMHGHDGSLFDPDGMPWLPLNVDDRTVLHMLRSVRYVQIGRGAKTSERRTVSFRTLDVEQIGYVYEGLLAIEGFRAGDVVVGLIGGGEVRLSELEDRAERHRDTGAGAALARRLTPLDGAEVEEARTKLLAVTGGDDLLSERLLPFHGLIRTDLRDLPVVILPGALFVTESALRRNTGTHYTPRFLAEEVVENALEPLVYQPGPLQTADRSRWRRRSAAGILSLKVADIAMGSAAFLVAAARYLAGHLIEAWIAEGRPDDELLVSEARRQIIEHCLYGVDINPMAVEMAKLSLWLVSMDAVRPFTFLDDRLVAGDSLLGITSLDQLEAMHLKADRGRVRLRGVGDLIARAAEERREIAEMTSGIAEKHSRLDAVESRTDRLHLPADLIVGAALANARRGDRALDAAAAEAARLASGDDEAARSRLKRWLATGAVEGGFARKPLHWPLTFPEVFENGGFDAIVGNPPFLGGLKLKSALGESYRDYLVELLGNGVRGVRGTGDLAAYFVLRAHQLLNGTGQTGLLATNTLAQGDSRKVGLDQLLADGVTIRRSVKSAPWPSRSATLEYCALWTSRSALGPDAQRVADGRVVADIGSSLDPGSRAAGRPERLAANAGRAFVGVYVLGLGFTVERSRARELIAADPRNRDVLFPYLIGEDVNSHPQCLAGRWIINFRDWPEPRARSYPELFSQVERLVKPERLANTYSKAARERWWQFMALRPNLIRAIAGSEQVIVIALVSRTVMPVLVRTDQVLSNMLGVFTTDDTAMLALLSSAPHYWWAVSRASSMKADLRYTLADVFETLPLPELTEELRGLGKELDAFRAEVMLRRRAGLTATYNLVFDPACRDDDILELRRLHRAIDVATCRAYGWDDLLEQGLDHGFHRSGTYVRYTVGPDAQREIVDRLLELNHRRHAAEGAAGLNDLRGRPE
ncbi:Eco57I restriction-modification methylase domain-containing protein [Actinoplanes aureus]|uniref:site-specific DNA-methyltransferase (adenine-specific) n=1 Tax=Actinoplanes aureus TaxID=2792083 RepID=A0A931FZN1_9ACTN|nr:type IIL restriction-modification enzyme MmeI [Actinoplanes aureus]MBG0564942.1 hypothetical protein [Actinoplanes aureus]